MPCNRCRVRHHKCNGKLPKCNQCQKAGERCVYETGLRIRRSSIQKAFKKDQKWIALPRTIDFFDETDDVRSQYEPGFVAPSRESPPLGFQAFSDSPVGTVTSAEVIPVSSLLNSESPIRLDVLSRTPSSISNSPANVIARHGSDEHLARSRPPSGHHSTTPAGFWPLENDQEAMLMGHYIDHVALFFDMCDAQKHFTFEVPQRARTNITLFNAIMALSARHLSRTSSFDTFVADRYYQICLQTLIPALNDSVAINDESLLAATIILRLLEELNIPITGDDPRSHLFGTHAILRAVQRRYDLNPVDTSFRQAIYWAAFRQELWISLMTQRPFQLHIFEADRSIEPANDSTWADRTIAHVGDVIHFAFGEGKHSVSRFNRLMEENESWRRRRPDSFIEFFHQRDRDGSGRNFPDIRCHADAHVMGRQYNILGRVLLVVHNPTIPQLGPAHKKAKMEVDIQVQEDVRTLVGVALSNERAFPASLVACFAIALVGDRFTNRQDQSQLREMLIKTETRHGWPTKAARSQLEEVWEWNSR